MESNASGDNKSLNAKYLTLTKYTSKAALTHQRSKTENQTPKERLKIKIIELQLWAKY